MRHDRRREGGSESDQSDEHERDTGPELLSYDTPGQLKHRVADDERHLDDADLKLRNAELGHHSIGGYGDGFLLHISQKSKAEQEGEYSPADGNRSHAFHGW